jgi:hypothetical protein
MIVTLKVLCLVVAVILFFIAAFVPYWTAAPRFNVMAAGLFFYALKDAVN